MLIINIKNLFLNKKKFSKSLNLEISNSKFTNMVEVNAINIELIGCIEEAIDKLQISGQIMPLTFEMKKNAKAVRFFLISISNMIH
jgi:hypothetical protein